VILMASSATTAERARGIDMGAVDFVTFPCDPVEMLARVHSALKIKGLLDLLERRAYLDGLTELGNRAALADRLPREWESCRVRGVPLSVVVADLDHFKQINDRYGHAAGDEVLRAAARALRRAARAEDFLARYGGEEFVLVAPGCDREGALGIAARLRAEVAGLAVRYRDHLIRVTSSVGVAVTAGPEPLEPDALVDRADKALYRAKAAGRNAVWAWDDARGEPLAA
jgi:diguanylate cyclase (GGDEF)-like protein